MELSFFSRSRKPEGNATFNWATICCSYEDYRNSMSSDWDGCFEQFSEETVLGLPVWHSINSDVQSEDYDEIRKMVTTLENVKPQCIFACTYEFFKRCLRYSYYDDEDSDKLENIGTYVTYDNRLLFHATLGEDDCVLLVAFDKSDE